MKKLILSCMAALMAVPAFAVEFTSGDFKANVFGNLFVDGFYTYSSENFEPVASSLRIGNDQHSFGSMAFAGSSNFGVTMSYQNISGTIEAGLGDPVRKFYLKYNINGNADHYILVGRDNNIAFYNYGQLSNDGQSLIDFGTLNNRRRLQLRYGIKGFEMAIIMPKIGYSSGDDKAYNDSLEYSYESFNEQNKPITVNDTINSADYMFEYLPRLELAYTLSNDNFNLKFFGSYGAYMYHNSTASEFIDAFDKVAHMFYIGFGGQANMGNHFLNYVAYFGQNMYLNNSQGDYHRAATALNPIFLAKNTVNNKYSVDVQDVYSAGGSLGYGYKALEGKLVTQFGVGYAANFADHYQGIDHNLGAFINTQYFVNDWFSVVPEIAFLHDLTDNTGSDRGFSVIAGLVGVLSF